jgi:tRNA nucleotidyltransferase/poly(A) polymerase
MKNFLDKIFFRSNNLDLISQNIKEISKNTPVKKIFDAISNHSNDSELRYVGGCVRKIINQEKIDDIDLASNLEPQLICEILKKNNIDYYETGISHGTITAIIDKHKFEITSLREDISTDGRHAEVKFSKNWKQDASRRDFTINSIYSDIDGNLFDPFEGKHDLEKGKIEFIGDADKRIKEDYLRILRYIRFHLQYSKKPHDINLIKKLKINIGGVSKISKERLLDELKKIIKSVTLEKLVKDKISLNLISLIFPELKNVNFFSKLKSPQKEIVNKSDFIFLISLMIIDETDNSDYFLFKFNISKKDQKRIKIIDRFYKDKSSFKKFTEHNFNKIFYYDGKQAVLDILNFKIIKSKKIDEKLIELRRFYSNRSIPDMPIGAELLIKKYNIPEGRQLGIKLRKIEEAWVENNFQITDKHVQNIINN